MKEFIELRWLAEAHKLEVVKVRTIDPVEREERRKSRALQSSQQYSFYLQQLSPSVSASKDTITKGFYLKLDSDQFKQPMRWTNPHQEILGIRDMMCKHQLLLMRLIWMRWLMLVSVKPISSISKTI